RKRYPAGEIPGGLDQGQGCSGARASRVTVEWTKAQRQCQQDEVGQTSRGVRGGHERNGTDNPIRELRFDHRLTSLSICYDYIFQNRLVRGAAWGGINEACVTAALGSAF